MIVTITGPSCAGKTTLEAMLVERGLSRAISTTTRPKREGETDGGAYYFIERDHFEDGVAAGGFVEHVEFCGNYYGLAVSEVDRLTALGKPIVVVCEPVGQKQIAKWCKANGHNLYAVFVDNPPEVIFERLLERTVSEVIGDRNGKQNSIVSTYAHRLSEMVTTEAAWCEEAWKGDSNYNLRLSEFNDGNDRLVADMIVEIASSK